MNIRTLTVLLIASRTMLLAALPDEGLSTIDQSRYHELCRQLISPCCWSQTVELHDSPAAAKAKLDVAGMIRSGKSNRQILDSFIGRYGERILAEPEGIKAVVLTAVPLTMLGLGGMALALLLVRMRRRAVLANTPLALVDLTVLGEIDLGE